MRIIIYRKYTYLIGCNILQIWMNEEFCTFSVFPTPFFLKQTLSLEGLCGSYILPKTTFSPSQHQSSINLLIAFTILILNQSDQSLLCFTKSYQLLPATSQFRELSSMDYIPFLWVPKCSHYSVYLNRDSYLLCILKYNGKELKNTTKILFF